MSRIALALMFGCAVLLASDASFARARGRVSSPPKPAAVQPTKAMTPAAARPSNRTTEQKPFAAAPRPGRTTFINLNSRPSTAAPANASAHRAMDDSAEHFGPLQYDASLGLTNENEPASPDATASKQALATKAAAKVQANEPEKGEALSTNLRFAPQWTPAPQPAIATAVCYVQQSGSCAAF